MQNVKSLARLASKNTPCNLEFFLFIIIIIFFFHMHVKVDIQDKLGFTP